jgi:competence protein ComEC
MVVLGIFVGLALAWQTLPQAPLRVDAHDPAWPKEVLVRGQVEEVRTYPGGRMVLLVPRPRVVTEHGETSFPGGLVWTWQNPPQRIAPGATFEARLRLRPIRGPANFGAPHPEARWLRRGMTVRAFSSHDARVSWISQPPNLRQRALERLAALCPDSERGMLLALVGGERFWLDPGLVDQVRRAGLAHSIALSGLHVGLVLGGAWLVAHGISRIFPRLLLVIPRPQLAALVGLPLVGGYLWLGGAGPSLVRAALMAAVGGWALWRTRRLWPQDALLVALACLLVADPASLLEPSTQLSFAAVAGILWAYPVGKKIHHHVKFFLPKPVRWLLGLAGVSFAATITTLPLQLFWFGVPSWGIVANIFWLPLLSFWVMPWAGIGTLASCIPGAENVAGLALGAAGWGTALLAKALAWADTLGLLHEWAVGRMGWQGCLAGAAGILAWLCWRRPWVRTAVLGLAFLFAGMEWQHWGSSGVRLTVLDTGGSQAVLLETPRNRILVDAGGSLSPDYDVGRQVVVPFLSWRAWPHLDALVASHHDTDHIGGMPAVLRLVAVAEYWTVGFLAVGQRPKIWNRR